VGSHLVDALLTNSDTKQVLVLDNFSSGKVEHLQHHGANIADGRLDIIRAELTAPEIVHHEAFKNVDCVLHLSANPDARLGISDTKLDLLQETVATRNILEAMRIEGVKKIVFSSSGTVYGDIGEIPATEEMMSSMPSSLYGAGKCASEALISAFSKTFGMKAVIFRFGNVVGERTTHGCIYDFLKQIEKQHETLKVLGNGLQAKPYIYVKDIVEGLMFGSALLDKMQDGQCDVFNLAPSGATSVRFIAEELLKQLGLNIGIEYGDTPNGWAGDVPQSRMDSSKLADAGFSLKRTSDEAVKLAIERILKN
jgi:UDP-glucose 4-epimerase